MFLEPYRTEPRRHALDVTAEGTGRFTTHHWTHMWAGANARGLYLNFDHNRYFLPWDDIQVGRTEFRPAGGTDWQTGLVVTLPTVIDVRLLVPWDEEELAWVLEQTNPVIEADLAKPGNWSDSFDDAIALFKKISHNFAITRGKDGALLFDGLALIEIKPQRVKAVDTLGAGDIFAGAFLYGLTHGMSFHQAGDLASLASGKIVTQFGPRLETEQTRELLNKFKAGN